MHVAMVIQSFPPVLGGAQRQLERVAPLLARRGIRVSVLTRRPPGTPRHESRDGFEVFRLPAPGPGPARSLIWSGRGAARLGALRPDVIHAHELLSPSTVALAGRRRLGVPVVAKVLASGPHGDVSRLLRKPFGRARLRAMAAGFDAFVSIDEAVTQELGEHGVDAARVRRIPNGVDADHFRPAAGDGERRALRRELGLPEDEFVALFCGRLVAEKRPAALVESMRHAPGVLVLSGEGPQGPELEALAGEPTLAGRVIVRPTTDDPARLYRAADAYVSASVQEGLSNAVLEAMASGLPVVASPAGGMGQLVCGDTGILVGDDSPEALGAALARLAGDGGLRARMGSAGRSRVRLEYSLQTTADLLCSLYEEVAAR